MKIKYETPEREIFKFSLKTIILAASEQTPEGSLTPGGSGGGIIDGDDIGGGGGFGEGGDNPFGP